MKEEFTKMLNEDDLKCNVCKHYLSVPPIIYTKSTGIICGRCEEYAYEKNSKPEIHRQKFFEKIGERIKFPCMYEDMGCEEKLGWENVEEHERSCDFKNISCLYNMEEFKKNYQVVCDWKGPVNLLMEHTKESHYENIISPLKFPIGNQLFENNFIFTQYGGHVVLVIFLYDNIEDVLTFLAVSNITRDKKTPLNYQVKFFDAAATCFSSPLASLYNILCKPELIKKRGLKLNVSKIRSMFQPSYFQINFISKEIVEDDSSVSKSTVTINTGKIPICAYQEKCSTRYLTPPVYLCYKKHNVCGECFEKNKKSCCHENNVRNYALEKLLYSSAWKCENSGCSNVSSVHDYGLHQKICGFRTRNCLSKDCTWNGNDLMSHVKKSHKIYELYQVLFLNKGEQQFFFIFDQRLFVLEKSFDYEITNETTNYTTAKFKLICLETLEFLYKYEIEIYWTESPHSKISFQQLVEPEHLPIAQEYEQSDIILENIINQLFPVETFLSFSVNISCIDD